MNGLPPGPGINTKWPSCTLQTVTLSVKPTQMKERGGLKNYAGKALFKGSSKGTDTQTCLPSRTSRFLPRKFRNAQN